MTKTFNIKANNIKKCHDKKFIHYIYDQIVDTIIEYSNVTKNKSFDSTNNTFYIHFDLKVSKDADFLFILIKEFLSLILETEENIELQIDEIEQTGLGTTYNIKKYKADPTSD